MKTKIYIALVLVLVLAALAAGTTSAQGPQPPEAVPPTERLTAPEMLPPGEPEIGKPFGLRAPFAWPAAGVAGVEAAAIPLGQPGFSFRYVQTFGFTEEGYFEDTAHLYNPSGVATDGTSVWIADSYGNRALKFDSAGNFLRQIGKASFREATGTSLDYISDMAVDSSGSIWVVDSGAQHVIKYSSTGQRLSELGQRWNSGSDNSRFDNPKGIAFGSAGHIYVSDSNNHRVQIFDNSGNYLATLGVTGEPGSDNGHFREPRRIAIYGNYLYVADAGNHRVQIFDITTPTGPSWVGTVGGSQGSGTSQFNYPEGVAVDAYYIYVADSNNNRVQIFDRSTRAYAATIGGSRGSSNNQFNYPIDVAVDASGNIYVADIWNNRVQQYNGGWAYQRTYGTTGVPYLTDGYHYNYPTGVAVAGDGSIYVIENRGKRLVKLNAAGVPQWTVGEPGISGTDNGHFRYPNGVALDKAGRVYVADTSNNRIQIFNGDGTYYATLGTGLGSGPYQFNTPYGVAVGQNGNIYVADRYNHRIQVYNADGAYIGTIGETGVSGSDNTHFNEPYDVAVDSAGNVYVADLSNHRVQRCTPGSSSWNCATIVGETGVSGSDFGHLSNPIGVTVDAAGRIYVADGWGGRVQVFDNSGAYLTTIGGSWGNRTGQMRQADGLAVDSDGNLYIAEYLNHRIQKFAPGVPGWKQVNINGFGDRTNGNIHTLAPFAGRLYAGTYNDAGNGAQLWRLEANGSWVPLITNGLGITRNIGFNHLITFNGQLYLGVRNDTDGASIYRSSDGDHWTSVVTGGFDSVQKTGVYRFAVFNNQLYAGTSSWTAGRGGEIWRSSSGDAGTWERVVASGFDNPNNYIMRSSEVHNGYLYFGTQNVDTSNYMTTTGGIVIRSSTGDSGSWTKITSDGLGDINNYAISGLASFNGYLYASTSRWSRSGVQVWRCQNCDGSDWEKVVDNGFDNPNNWGVSTLQVFSGELYLVIGNGITGMEVWRTQTGNLGEWIKVSDGGFGDSNNSSPYYNNVTVFNNRLYIGTQNGANSPEVWKKTVTADFSASPTVGAPGTTVTFTNLSGDFTSATWDFGDGSPPVTTNAATVQHTYTAPGTYTVALTVTDGVDTDTMARPSYIQIAHQLFLPLVQRNYNPLLALYDDFNNPAYDGFYNPLKWQFWGDPNYFSMYQQDGTMVLTTTGNAPGERDTVLVASMPLDRTLSQVQRFQAKLMFSANTARWAPKIQIMAEDVGTPGRYWWTSCDLFAHGFGCAISSSTGHDWDVSAPFQVYPNQWYEARIEINPTTVQICFYVNNTLLDCHVPNDAAALKTATRFTARIGAWNGDANPTGILYFDDVYITPAGP